MSDVFCVVYVVQYIAKNCFSKYCSSHCTMGLPGRYRPPGNLRFTTTQRVNNLFVFKQNPKPFDMENRTVTEIAPMEVGIKKGFLESSEEFVSMIPFKEHASGLAAYEER